MEDVYTIKVKTKPDTRNLYPSERRYSASTASGLAWVHIALATTSFLLACLALINQSGEKTEKFDVKIADTLVLNLTEEVNTNNTDVINDTEVNVNNWYVLVIAACLLSVFALSAGIASIVASIKWYIDHNITWLLIMSSLSTLFSFISFVMVLIWFTNTEGSEISQFYKDANFKDYFIVKQSDVIDRNISHIVVGQNETTIEEHSNLFTKRVLSINVLIAAFLEFIWSILSVKIAYKGMMNKYKDTDDRHGSCIEVVTTFKGNDGKIRRKGGILPPKPDLIANTNKNIKRVILSQDQNGFYLKNSEGDKARKEESNSEYKERMINFLNGCGNNMVYDTPSLRSEATENIQEPRTPVRETMTPISWGDTPEHTIYNQNNINFDKIFKLQAKKERTQAKELNEHE